MSHRWIREHFAVDPAGECGVVVRPELEGTFEFEPWCLISAKRKRWFVELQGKKVKVQWIIDVLLGYPAK